MIRKTVTGILVLMLVFVVIGEVLALEKGNDRKGKYVYRKVYKACYERGGADSLTPPLSPNTKTQAQWEEVFTNQDFVQFSCDQEWSLLNEEEVRDIFTYLYNHASDSPSPAQCK